LKGTDTVNCKTAFCWNLLILPFSKLFQFHCWQYRY